MSMAWFRPDLFRRVIAYSGTFVDQQDDDAPEEKQFPKLKILSIAGLLAKAIGYTHSDQSVSSLFD